MIGIPKQSLAKYLGKGTSEVGLLLVALLVSGLAFLLSGYAIRARAFQGQNPPSEPAKAAPQAANNGEGEVATLMKNVECRLTDSIIVHIVRLEGKLTPKPDHVVVFDDKQSYGIEVSSANVSLTPSALTNDLNEYVFVKPDAPLKKLTATIEGTDLTVKGQLASKGNIPFESTGSLSVTPEGMIRIHTTKVRALHLPVKGLMDLLGLDIANLLSTKKVSGVWLDKDDLILDAQLFLPPPQLHGQLTAIKIENGEIALVFGNPGSDEHRPALTNSCGAHNYLQFKGGAVRFGKLTMANSDLVLMDMDPADPFDFSLEHYKNQLVAGYSKSTRQGGLCVHMPDFNKLKKAP